MSQVSFHCADSPHLLHETFYNKLYYGYTIFIDIIHSLGHFLTSCENGKIQTLDLMVMSYEESVVDKFKSNLLLVIFWLNIIDYNS